MPWPKGKPLSAATKLKIGMGMRRSYIVKSLNKKLAEFNGYPHIPETELAIHALVNSFLEDLKQVGVILPSPLRLLLSTKHASILVEKE
jgi:hypothetical protein